MVILWVRIFSSFSCALTGHVCVHIADFTLLCCFQAETCTHSSYPAMSPAEIEVTPTCLIVQASCHFTEAEMLT